jgi:hypothetical protein
MTTAREYAYGPAQGFLDSKIGTASNKAQFKAQRWDVFGRRPEVIDAKSLSPDERSSLRTFLLRQNGAEDVDR